MDTPLTMGKLLRVVNGLVNDFSSRGYARQQESTKDRCKGVFLKRLRQKYPSIKDEFLVGDYYGIGAYSCYSDFSLAYKGVTLIGIGTHSQTVEKAYYKADYDVSDMDEILRRNGVDSVDDVFLDDFVEWVIDFRIDEEKAQLEQQIREAERKLVDLRRQHEMVEWKWGRKYHENNLHLQSNHH